MNSNNIVILGAGIGGLVLANRLRQKLPGMHRIILIDKNPNHAFAPSFLWVMTGDRKPEAITKPLHSMIRPGIDLIVGEATGIDPTSQSVAVAGQALPYDYLILALGAELAPALIPGLNETAFSFYTLEEASRLHDKLKSFASGHVALVVASVPYKCPGAPHEATMLLADLFHRRGLSRDVKVHLYTPEPQPMPVAGPQLGQNVIAMLESRGVGFYPMHKITSVDAEKQVISFAGCPPASYDLLIAIPPHRAPAVVQKAGLTNESGWVPVDRASLKTQWKNVYAIGDLTAISLPGRWKPDVPMMLPKAGVFAHDHAETVADRLMDEINGRTPRSEFCGSGYCMLEAGDNAAGFAYGDFFAVPAPKLHLRKLGKAWHWGKVLFEKWWLAPFGLRKAILGNWLKLGSTLLRIPVRL